MKTSPAYVPRAFVLVLLLSTVWQAAPGNALEGSAGDDSPGFKPYFVEPGEFRPWGWPPPRMARELPDFDAGIGPLRGGDPSQWQEATVILTTGTGFGSGALISSDGWIISNYHVVATAAQRAAVTGNLPLQVGVILCAVSSEGYAERRDEKLTATLYRVDPVKDLSLLKIDALPSDADSVPFFRIYDDAVVPGGKCFVVGSQGGGPPWAVRSGNVIGPYRFPGGMTEPVTDDITEMFLERSRIDILITDCPVSSGDSGGPLVNPSGDLIGLTFATPANFASGSMGYHVRAHEITTFLEVTPDGPEECPLDPWIAGFPFASRGQPLLDDGDRMNVLKYSFWESNDKLAAEMIFFDFKNRDNSPVTLEDSVSWYVPAGLWGMEDRGRYLFDVFLLRRNDKTLALGFTNEEGVVDRIRIDTTGDLKCEILWNRAGDGTWTHAKGESAPGIIDAEGLSPGDREKLGKILGVVPRQ